MADKRKQGDLTDSFSDLDLSQKRYRDSDSVDESFMMTTSTPLKDEGKLTAEKIAELVASSVTAKLKGLTDSLPDMISEVLIEQLKPVMERVDELEEEMGRRKEDIIGVKASYIEIAKDLRFVQGELLSTRRHAIRNEQYTRGYNLRFTGVKEEVGEEMKEVIMRICKETMEIENIQLEDISVAHRLKADYNPRPIIVRFGRKEARYSVWKAKKKLKGTKIGINEDLTRETNLIYNRARKNEDIHSCWTWNGEVKFRLEDKGRVYTLQYGQPLHEAVRQQQTHS